MGKLSEHVIMFDDVLPGDFLIADTQNPTSIVAQRNKNVRGFIGSSDSILFSNSGGRGQQTENLVQDSAKQDMFHDYMILNPQVGTKPSGIFGSSDNDAFRRATMGAASYNKGRLMSRNNFSLGFRQQFIG